MHPPSHARPLGWVGGACLALAAALLLSSRLPRQREAEVTLARATARDQGLTYEQHVLSPGNLPAQVAAVGGHLVAHPRLPVARRRVAARYFAVPDGWSAGATVDERPHRHASRWWWSVGPGGYRVPDAIATGTDGSQTLFEIKCPSPWLRFPGGQIWATWMQTAFASQALAYLTWAAEDPAHRRVHYLFCGLIPPWAEALLRHLEAEVGVGPRVLEAQFSAGFPPARRFVLAVEGDQPPRPAAAAPVAPVAYDEEAD